MTGGAAIGLLQERYTKHEGWIVPFVMEVCGHQGATISKSQLQRT